MARSKRRYFGRAQRKRAVRQKVDADRRRVAEMIANGATIYAHPDDVTLTIACLEAAVAGLGGIVKPHAYVARGKQIVVDHKAIQRNTEKFFSWVQL